MKRVDHRPFDNSILNFKSDFSIKGLPNSVITLLLKGETRLAIREAIHIGMNGESFLTDIIFHQRHPERKGKSLNKNEPNYDTLAKEWMNIQGGIIRPELARYATSVKYFICNNDYVEDIYSIVNLIIIDENFEWVDSPEISVTHDMLKNKIERAAKDAVLFTLSAAHSLKNSYRTERIREYFSQSFGHCPEYLPKYYEKKNRSWNDYGDLVALRLTDAIELIQSGSTKYYCNSQLCNSKIIAYNEPGKIVVCDSFWEKFKDKILIQQNSKLGPIEKSIKIKELNADMSTTILHEALHRYYGRFLDRHNISTRITNIFCYEAFVWRVNELGNPDFSDIDCDGEACCPDILDKCI